MKHVALVCLLLCGFASIHGQQGRDSIDFNKARQLLERRQRGETLTSDERTYLERAITERRKQADRPANQRPAPERLTPLTDMTANDRYEGEDGGLYGGGRNAPPDTHRQAAEAELAKIRPLDADGDPEESGIIGLVAISMSNATQEFSRFKQIADRSPLKSPKVVIVDCAQGGQAMAEWAPAGARPWEEARRRLTIAKVSLRQVQAAWIKLANKGPAGSLEEHGRKLERDTLAVLHNAKEQFPNLRVVYLGSRTYGGFAVGPLNPEPYAYESAFAARRLIQRQAQGDSELGLTKTPLLLWGPYLWAEGTKGRKLDSLVWGRADFGADGVHPSDSGRQKVAELLLKFLTTDPFAKPWFAPPVAGRIVSLTTAARPLEEIPQHRKAQIEKAAPDKPQVAPKKARRVLVFITPPHLMEKDPHKGYCIPYGAYAFEVLGRKTGAYEPLVSDDLALFLPEKIGQFDAIVLNNSSGPWITPTDADLSKEAFQPHGANQTALEEILRNSLLQFVRKGGGVVAVHYATGANRHWPEFKQLLGATFTGHPWNEEIGVRVEEPAHPLTAAFGGKDFRLADEIYEYGDPFDRAAVRVLLSLDPARSNMGVRWIHRKDNNFALAWAKRYGQGRVFNTSFGHRTEIYWHPQILQLYLDAVQFAAGDLEAPAAPRADRPRQAIPGAEPAPGLPGFANLFNGRDLAGWDGDRRIWSVRDGAITGQTSESVRVAENNFLLWKDEVEDFELRLKFKLEGGNSGIYYRARQRPPGQAKGEAVVGAQADFSADGRWTGVLMEYTLREVLAERGYQVFIETNGTKRVTATLGDPAQLLEWVKPNDWNDYTVFAKGGQVRLTINGVTMCELDDRDPKRLARGWLALQVHTGPPMRVQFKDIYLRRL